MSKSGIALREEIEGELECNSSARERTLKITDTKDKSLGKVSFSVPNEKGLVSFQPEIVDVKCTGKCLEAIVSWAAMQQGWTQLRIYTHDEDKVINTAVKRQGFLSTVDEQGRLCWEKRLDDGNYIFVLAVIGLLLGCIIGGFLGYLSYGLIGGVLLGLMFGVLLWWRDKKKSNTVKKV